MNHVRYLERLLEFVPLRYEHLIPFPLEDRINLEFLWCQVNGAANPPDAGHLIGIFPNDARAYIDGVEVTASVIIELQKKISARKVTDVQAEYKSGLDAWFRLGDAIGAAYPGDLAKDKTLAATLIANQNPANLLDRLGDGRIGAGGALHIFNYLYEHIRIDPISMWDVVKTHNDSGGTSIDVKKSPTPRLVLSMGPCRLYDAGFDPKKFPGQGALRFRMILSYHDPLEDVVKELERKLDRLQKKILARLDTIAAACEDGGPFQLSIAALKGAVAGLQQDVSTMKADVASNEAQSKALQAQAKALQDAVNQL